MVIEYVNIFILNMILGFNVAKSELCWIFALTKKAPGLSVYEFGKKLQSWIDRWIEKEAEFQSLKQKAIVWKSYTTKKPIDKGNYELILSTIFSF